MAFRPTSAATNRQARLHRRLVKGDSLIGPGCLPSTSAPSARFTRCSRSTIRGLDRSPTPFRLFFAVPSRAPEGERAGTAEARPGARRRGPCAAHRLLQSTQSASTTAGPPEPRSAPWEVALFCAVPRLGEIETPPTPEVRLRAHLAPDVRSRARLDDATGWRRASARDEPRGPLSLQNGSSRGFTGQGPDGFRHPAPLAAIPRGESFAPTRSARTPRVVSSWRRGRKSQRRREPARVLEARVTGPATSPPREPACAMPAIAPRRPAHAGPPGRGKPLTQPFHRRGWVACADTIRGQGPPHPILREEDRDPLHPRCLPSMGCPVRGRTFSTACLQPVENLRRLCDPRPPLPSLTGR